MNTTFQERMVGPIRLLPEPEGVAIRLPARPEVIGDDIVDLARRSFDASASGPASSPGSGHRLSDLARRTLDLDALVLRLEGRTNARDGYAADVVSGRVSGLSGFTRRPIVTGFADLLHRAGPGQRRMYYRLLVGGLHDLHVVEGVKIVEGCRLAAWRQTTTLFTRVSRFPRAADPDAVAGELESAVEGVVPVAAGILRIRPDDLAAQAASMRGGVPGFLAGFLWRLLVR